MTCPWTYFYNAGLNMSPPDSFMFKLSSTGIFHRRVLVFATDCPCGVSCRVLITCLLYVFIAYASVYIFTYILISRYIQEHYLYLSYFHVPNGVLFLPSTVALCVFFHRRNLDLYIEAGYTSVSSVFGAKPLSEWMLVYCWFHPSEHISVKFK